MDFLKPTTETNCHGRLYMFWKFQKLALNVLPFFSLIRTHITSKTGKEKKTHFRKKTRPFHHTSFPLHSRCFDISHMFAQEPKVFGSGPGTFAQHRWSSGAGRCLSSSAATYGDRDQDASHGEAPNQGMFGRYGRY